MNRREFACGISTAMLAFSGCIGEDNANDGSSPQDDLPENPSTDDSEENETERESAKKIADGVSSNSFDNPRTTNEVLISGDEYEIYWEATPSQRFVRRINERMFINVNNVGSDLYLWSNSSLSSFDISTGAEQVIADIPDNLSHRVIEDNLIITFAGGDLMGIDTSRQEIVWRRTPPFQITDMVVIDGSLWVTYRGGAIQLFDPQTGEDIERFSMYTNPEEDAFSRIMAARNGLVCISWLDYPDGVIECYDAESRERVWEKIGYPVGDRWTQSSLWFVHYRGEFEQGGDLLEIDLETGEIQSNRAVGETYDFVISDDSVILSTEEAYVCASMDGEVKWTTGLHADSMAITGDTVLFRTYESEDFENQRGITALDLETGLISWELKPDGSQLSRPILTDYGVLVSRDETLQLLR